MSCACQTGTAAQTHHRVGAEDPPGPIRDHGFDLVRRDIARPTRRRRLERRQGVQSSLSELGPERLEDRSAVEIRLERALGSHLRLRAGLGIVGPGGEDEQPPVATQRAQTPSDGLIALIVADRLLGRDACILDAVDDVGETGALANRRVDRRLDLLAVADHAK